ncbi:hypothetical protein CCUS01_16149 [Colletotrichum cuscutae]|uniref:Uncharacterized protein n=1 Tax=Colletotrichum cuscutae TaxID=1209917 RepID=A0AAI9VEU8_9PEZI|nr:hypothetical protein CCUS01_16149 [Colletotrichum cuscutae]
MSLNDYFGKDLHHMKGRNDESPKPESTATGYLIQNFGAPDLLDSSDWRGTPARRRYSYGNRTFVTLLGRRSRTRTPKTELAADERESQVKGREKRNKLTKAGMEDKRQRGTNWGEKLKKIPNGQKRRNKVQSEEKRREEARSGEDIAVLKKEHGPTPTPTYPSHLHLHWHATYLTKDVGQKHCWPPKNPDTSSDEEIRTESHVTHDEGHSFFFSSRTGERGQEAVKTARGFPLPVNLVAYRRRRVQLFVFSVGFNGIRRRQGKLRQMNNDGDRLLSKQAGRQNILMRGVDGLVEVNSGNPLPEVGTLGTLPYSPQGNVDWNEEKEGEAPTVYLSMAASCSSCMSLSFSSFGFLTRSTCAYLEHHRKSCIPIRGQAKMKWETLGLFVTLDLLCFPSRQVTSAARHGFWRLPRTLTRFDRGCGNGNGGPVNGKDSAVHPLFLLPCPIPSSQYFRRTTESSLRRITSADVPPWDRPKLFLKNKPRTNSAPSLTGPCRIVGERWPHPTPTTCYLPGRPIPSRRIACTPSRDGANPAWVYNGQARA